MWMHVGRVAIAAVLLWLALRGEDIGRLGQPVARPSWPWIAGVLTMVIV